MSMRFDNRVAIVTGAGSGLGRSHALELARRGAKVVINDLGRNGNNSDGALAVVEQIKRAGGEAIANPANVADREQVAAMVAQAMQAFGRIDVLINNAGILRDKSFNKMELDDFDIVVDVHLRGAAYCTKAVWDIMRTQQYGRIVMTSSSSGLYGNFGQANYSAAKLALVGFMNTLGLEGEKYNVRVNSLVPAAATAMTEGLINQQALDMMQPQQVTPAALFLAHEDAPTRTILCACAGTFTVARIVEGQGVWLAPDEQTPEGIAAHWAQVADASRLAPLSAAWEQTQKFLQLAASAQDLELVL
jgi:NAD(P)-dependent dehydrogenase (short-subunit alcohol dehydrogenase family)